MQNKNFSRLEKQYQIDYMFVCLGLIILMITDNMNKRNKDRPVGRMLRIIKEQQNGLVVTNGTEDMIFRRYTIDDEKVHQHLQKRIHLKHQSLIKIYNIEFSKKQKLDGGQGDELQCGIVFQKYTKTMQQSIKEMVNFTHNEVIETFTPIKEVIDYFVFHHYDPGQITYSSIVCNNQYQTKFIDSFLHSSKLKNEQRDSNVYEELAQLLFCLLFPQVKNKSWKIRYEVAQEHLQKEAFILFQDIYKKFAKIPSKQRKSKRIKKQIKQGKIRSSEFIVKNDSSAQKKSVYEPSINCQQGKQNQIIQ